MAFSIRHYNKQLNMVRTIKLTNENASVGQCKIKILLNQLPQESNYFYGYNDCLNKERKLPTSDEYQGMNCNCGEINVRPNSQKLFSNLFSICSGLA